MQPQLLYKELRLYTVKGMCVPAFDILAYGRNVDQRCTFLGIILFYIIY